MELAVKQPMNTQLVASVQGDANAVQLEG